MGGRPKGSFLLPKVEGCGRCAERRELAEPGVEEFDGVDGVGAGAVENLLAAGGTRSDDDGRGGGSDRGRGRSR